MNMTKNEILDLLNKYIDDNKIKYIEIAYRMSLSEQTVKNKLRGKTEFSIDELNSLCDILGLELLVKINL